MLAVGVLWEGARERGAGIREAHLALEELRALLFVLKHQPQPIWVLEAARVMVLIIAVISSCPKRLL